ncbi:fibrinogen-like protein 1 isoform X2 [Rhopilema esculentum]|uniref:fibrinogen-like protein 1 isoform X2 n=1 Tax=Rhopilema esculentum TaxID=499914 RepID=UPI0031DA7488
MAMKRCYVVNAFLVQTCIMLVKSQFSTLGNFFVPLKVDDEVSLEEGETFITQNFLSCSGTETCSIVFKEKNTEMNYHLTKERRSVLKYKTEGVLWQKVKQPTDCKDLYDSGKRDSGIYHIARPNKELFEVNCDMETDGGGWTVLQRRIDNSTDFQRVWSDYKHGFGSIDKNMWIGLENMHLLAGPTVSSSLRIEIKDRLSGEKIFFSNYDTFSIGNETDGYRLRVSGYSGTAGDAFNMSVSEDFAQNRPNFQIFMGNDGMKFTTIDRDNEDNFLTNCAVEYNGGWWYSICHSCHINGLLPLSKTPSYTWRIVDSRYCCISFSEMKVRRNHV